MGLADDLLVARGHIKNYPDFTNYSGSGNAPSLWYGDDALDGTAVPWLNTSVGSIYEYKASETANPRLYIKRQNNGRTDDWSSLGPHCIEQRVTKAEFTDGGSTSGTFALTETIPIGAWVYQTILQNVTAFSGDTTAVIIVGDGSDTDRYNTGTPSVFTTANAIDLGVPSGTKIHTAAATVTLTITSTADFTNVSSSGALTIRIWYLL